MGSTEMGGHEPGFIGEVGIGLSVFVGDLVRGAEAGGT